MLIFVAAECEILSRGPVGLQSQQYKSKVNIKLNITTGNDRR